jgi:hypothetical protein
MIMRAALGAIVTIAVAAVSITAGVARPRRNVPRARPPRRSAPLILQA